jgi:hypothetical protein
MASLQETGKNSASTEFGKCGGWLLTTMLTFTRQCCFTLKICISILSATFTYNSLVIVVPSDKFFAAYTSCVVILRFSRQKFLGIGFLSYIFSVMPTLIFNLAFNHVTGCNLLILVFFLVEVIQETRCILYGEGVHQLDWVFSNKMNCKRYAYLA